MNQKWKHLVGSIVTVFTGQEIRNTFEPSISVSGTLEKHPDKDDYRIVITDGNYCYFRPANVVSVTQQEGHTFKDGSCAVLKLKF